MGGLDQGEVLDIVNSVASGSSKQYQSVRPSDTINADATYFSGRHEFKFGYALRRASTNSSSLLPGNGIEARIETARGKIARIQRELVSAFKGSYNSLYLQDTFSTSRFTLTGGVRWDLQKAENAASTAAANPLFPEILPDLVYDGTGTKISWSDISPRVGFTYALNDSHKTQVRGNFSIFTQQLAHPDVTVVNPIGGVARVDYRWIDANNNNLVDGRERGRHRRRLARRAGERLAQHRQRDRRGLQGAARHGGAVRDRPRAGAELRGERHLHATAATTNSPYMSYIGVNGSDWVACDSVTGNGYTVPCLDLGPQNAAAAEAAELRPAPQQPARLPPQLQRPRAHRGQAALEPLDGPRRLRLQQLDRVVRRHGRHPEPAAGPLRRLRLLRPQHRSLTDAKKSGGQVGYYSTGSGTLYWMPSKWQFSANALYQIGKGFEIAGNLYAREGYIRPINLTVNNTFADSVLAVDVGDQRLPNIWNLDMRLAWNKAIGGAQLNLSADVFNVFNSGTVLRRVDAADSARSTASTRSSIRCSYASERG